MLTDEEKRILLAKQAFRRASCGAAGRAAAKAFLPHGLLWKKQRDLGHGRADRPCGDRAVRARGGVAVHAGWTGKPFRGTRGRRTVWGCFDVGPDGRQPVELRTARPSKILFLSLDALLRCCAEDGGSDCTRLLSNLLEEISEKYWALQRHIRLLSIPDGRTRLEAYLRQEAGKTGEIVCAGMTREQMARYLGMNRSALSRLLGTMQREGRLELRRGSLRLLNDIET